MQPRPQLNVVFEKDSLLIRYNTPTTKENSCDGYFMVVPGVLRLSIMSECVCESVFGLD